MSPGILQPSQKCNKWLVEGHGRTLDMLYSQAVWGKWVTVDMRGKVYCSLQVIAENWVSNDLQSTWNNFFAAGGLELKYSLTLIKQQIYYLWMPWSKRSNFTELCRDYWTRSHFLLIYFRDEVVRVTLSAVTVGRRWLLMSLCARLPHLFRWLGLAWTGENCFCCLIHDQVCLRRPLLCWLFIIRTRRQQSWNEKKKYFGFIIHVILYGDLCKAGPCSKRSSYLLNILDGGSGYSQ